MDTIKEFHLKRVEDETGISGTGVVARGVILPSGGVCMEWQTFHSSVCWYKNIGDVEAIHGHNGKTLLVMGPPPAKPEVPPLHKRRTDLESYCGDAAKVGESLLNTWKNVTCEECLKHKKR